MQVKKSQLKKAIADAARREFIKHGFRGASLRTIAKKAGCSLGNLYNYFDSKDSLFQSLLKDRIDEIRAGLLVAKETTPPDGEYILDLAEEQKHRRVVVDYIDAHREELKLIFLKSQGSSVEDFSEYVVEQYQEMWSNYVLFLRKNFPHKMRNRVSDFFIHSLSSANLNSLMEFLTHDISLEEMRSISDEMTVYCYYGFVGLMEH